ncbi:MAG TPA: multidrug efflux RND transporter permease subunit [Chthoniobacteraceae bacterium]|nr:multidrug efflux RND transporter permease subunit [Chthoniobacteraceae bacterium]
MSHFFINRPIMAMVLSIILLIVGLITAAFLPVAQFPEIASPDIQVLATYLGADAETVEKAVATPIEQQMSGVDNMNYMVSVNANNGKMALTVNFDLKTDPNTDQILTQMREKQAEPQLPGDVTELGVTVRKSSAAPLLVLALYSPDSSRDALFLSNYAYINLNDELTRLPGVSNVQVAGAGEYAMRLWINPESLAALSITVPDIISAIEAQNTVNSAGQIGAEPAPKGQKFTYSAVAQGRLVTAEEFGNIVVRQTADGGAVRLSDVAQIELGAVNYGVKGRFNGKPAAVVSIYQAPGSNAVETARNVRNRIEELKERFPVGVDYKVSLDTTEAVTEGMHEIFTTLLEALCLVLLVVFLFLQNWRATLIPLLAVPVSLVGAFTVFPLLGFSINTLSLFGLVLAIGLVVDDAIVVVEAVGAHIENGMEPREATFQAMKEISGPVVGIALVLASVFVPTAFIPGITGRLYQQFAVTIAVSVMISALNALTLSPALCALLLKPHQKTGGLAGRFFDGFNRIFGYATNGYVRVCSGLIRKSGLAMVLLLASIVAAGWFGKAVPASFLPDEDQGFLYVNLQLPPAASLQRTDEACRRIEKILAEIPGVEQVTTTVGSSLLSGVETTYNGFFFVTLKPWGERTSNEESYLAIKERINRELTQVSQGIAFAVSPPAIPGIGASGGVTFVLQDRAGKELDFLAKNVDTFLEAARKRPELAQVSTTFLPNVPGLFVDVDQAKVLKQEASVDDVYQTLQTFMGGSFVNYFNRFGRQWQVYVQAEGSNRAAAESIDQFYVRNRKAEMIPLSSFTRVETRSGPEFTMRYNLYRSAQINADPAPGYTSSQAMTALEEVHAATMPREIGYDYLGMSFQEKKAQEGISPMLIFAMSLLFVFLILAALYESWSLPFSVLLCTPIAVFGAFATLWLRRWVALQISPAFLVQMENSIYAQIGLVMIIGLVAKNAILIVEFAKAEVEAGKPLIDAALSGARLRLRPILMTSLAFILGCIPLWTASGAGAVARQVMGTTVIGGMLAATFLALFIVPVSFYLVEKIAGTRPEMPKTKEPETAPAPSTMA